jgi:hypothetical protein
MEAFRKIAAQTSQTPNNKGEEEPRGSDSARLIAV